MRSLTRIGATMIGVWFLAISPVQAGDVSCGDPIGPNEKVTLHEDIGPCSTSPALLVLSQSTLNLNGHTVSCTVQTPIGIYMDGERSKLLNGEVYFCDVGVLIESGGGRNTVKNVTADDNNFGFVIRSGRNKLSGNIAIDNIADGFQLNTPNGDRNSFTGNSAHYNGDDGFDIVHPDADHNEFVGNDAIDNDGEGFENFGEFNTFLRNTAALNRVGFFLNSLANDNTLEKNLAIMNDQDGIRLAGSDSNLVIGNRTNDNIQRGILLDAGANDNVVKMNKARDNVIVDLEDGNANCGTNQWIMNVFVTSDDGGSGCID